MAVFTKAKKSQSKLKLALEGPAGMGKTYSALLIAKGLGGKVAVIDTEAGSSSKYADIADFDSLTLDNYSPKNYIEAIDSAVGAGYSTVIVDSLSHAWMGKGGVLEIADNAAKRSKSGNSFTAWKEATPEHDKLMERIIQAPINIIATMRAKTEYVIEEINGRKQPRKIGMAAVQRDGTDFLFDVVGEFVSNSELAITKTRYSKIANAVLKPSVEFGQELAAWLSDGVPYVAPVVADVAAKTVVAIECAPSQAILDGIGKEVKALYESKQINEAQLTSIRNAFAAKKGQFSNGSLNAQG